MPGPSSASAPTAGGVLHALRVIDLSRHRAGALATLLLAELGADVVKVRLAQDHRRRLAPVLAALHDRSKAMLAIDLDAPAGRDALLGWVGRADVVLHDRVPAEMAALGLDLAALCAADPSLIVAAIGAWPASHAERDCPVQDTLVLAQSGICDEQQAFGRAGPVFLAFPLGSLHAAYLAAIGVVTRVLMRTKTGQGGTVATSLVQGALLPMMLYWARASDPVPGLDGGVSKDNSLPLFECADGRWMHVMGDPAKAPSVAALLAAMGPDGVAAANLRHAAGRPQIYPDLGALAEIFRQRPCAEWLAELWASDVPVQPVTAVGELFADPQVSANGYAIEVASTQFGQTTQAAVPITLEPPVRQQVRAALPDWEPRVAPVASALAGPHPLAGIRVLDFGSFLAGPLATMLLADLGADVIKIEAIAGEPLRAAEWAFNASQRGKRTLALDLAHSGARAIIEALVRGADIVHHNMRMPAARKLGIDYATLKAINPRIIYTHVSAYGPSGPHKDWPGYDQLFQAASGWDTLSAGAGQPPAWLRFGMMDHLAALNSLLGTVAALHARGEGDDGQVVAASLLGASLFTLPTALREDGSLLPTAQVDGRQMGFSAAERLYRCADGWVAVYAEGPGAVQAVLQAGASASVEQLEQRLLGASVDQARAWMGGAGIACVVATAANQQRFFDDPDNRASGLVAGYPHPVYGHFEQPGAMWEFGDSALALGRAPPLLGQHTREILAELGFSSAQIDAFCAQKVAGTGSAPANAPSLP